MSKRLRMLTMVGLSLTACLAGARCNLQTGGTGTLKLLITDKPFPFDLIEEALVTITRVEVRRADEGDVCNDADCDDGVTCNGTEVCDAATNLCVAGTPPACAAGEVCDEIRGGCFPECIADADCDDGLFCNGAESCETLLGVCDPGTPLACEVDEVCDETTMGCVEDTDPVDPDDDRPFIVIYDGEATGGKTFNLLDLQNGRTDLLADATIQEGTYTQMRIFVTQGEVKVVDVDEPFVLTVPSGAQSGIKLNFAFDITADTETTLLLDVDMSRAFTPIPGGMIDDPTTIDGFKFSPSIAMRLIHLIDAGSISGTVTTMEGGATLPVVGASVTAYDANDVEVTTTATDVDGTYALSGLPAGDYRVDFSASGFEDASVADVNVAAGAETSDVDAELTPIP